MDKKKALKVLLCSYTKGSNPTFTSIVKDILVAKPTSIVTPADFKYTASQISSKLQENKELNTADPSFFTFVCDKESFYKQFPGGDPFAKTVTYSSWISATLGSSLWEHQITDSYTQGQGVLVTQILIRNHIAFLDSILQEKTVSLYPYHLRIYVYDKDKFNVKDLGIPANNVELKFVFDGNNRPVRDPTKEGSIPDFVKKFIAEKLMSKKNAGLTIGPSDHKKFLEHHKGKAKDKEGAFDLFMGPAFVGISGSPGYAYGKNVGWGKLTVGELGGEVYTYGPRSDRIFDTPFGPLFIVEVNSDVISEEDRPRLIHQVTAAVRLIHFSWPDNQTQKPVVMGVYTNSDSKAEVILGYKPDPKKHRVEIALLRTFDLRIADEAQQFYIYLFNFTDYLKEILPKFSHKAPGDTGKDKNKDPVPVRDYIKQSPQYVGLKSLKSTKKKD